MTISPSKMNRIIQELHRTAADEIRIIDEAREVPDTLYEGRYGNQTVLSNSQDVIKAIEEAEYHAD